MSEIRHNSFVGLDSDGCVIDTMRIKQREHIQKAIIRTWRLEPWQDALLECSEFVNMNSVTRGVNRMKALLMTFEFFNSHPDAKDAPKLETSALREYCESGLALGTPSLTKWLETHNDENLKLILKWNNEINRELVEKMRPVPVFKNAFKALQIMKEKSDLAVISQAPKSSLTHEWKNLGILDCVTMVLGQEVGNKVEQLQIGTNGQYEKNRILMIGDSMGDLDAAEKFNTLFYPILPDKEEASWERFIDEAYPRFLENTYAGVYENECVRLLNESLVRTPPWQRQEHK